MKIKTWFNLWSKKVNRHKRMADSLARHLAKIPSPEKVEACINWDRGAGRLLALSAEWFGQERS
jgi:hypothetical protein